MKVLGSLSAAFRWEEPSLSTVTEGQAPGHQDPGKSLNMLDFLLVLGTISHSRAQTLSCLEWYLMHFIKDYLRVMWKGADPEAHRIVLSLRHALK